MAKETLIIFLILKLNIFLHIKGMKMNLYHDSKNDALVAIRLWKHLHRFNEILLLFRRARN